MVTTGTTSNEVPRRTAADTLRGYMPGLGLVHTYQRAWLSADILAGVTVFAILVPQGIAYGSLAGVTPVAGLYAAIAAMLAYAVFGSSRQLIVGPESGIAIMAATVLAPLAAGSGTARYAALAGLLAVMAGLVTMAGGLARLGFIADFLSKPILLGYTDGVALIIIASQLGKLFGIKIEALNFFPSLLEFGQKLDQTQGLTLALGLVLVAILVILRRVAPRIPSALVVVILATIASEIFHLQQHGVAVVGHIPAGLPRPTLPAVSFRDVYNLLPGAFSLSLVTFADGVLTARLFARKNGYEIDADQEMIGLGVANLVAGLTQGFPMGASNSRTVVNDGAGGRTQLVGVVATVLVCIFLLFFTGLLQNLPLVTLAAIVIVAAANLITVQPVVRLYRVLPIECWLAVATLLAVLALGILYGILVAVALSLLNVIARIARPHSAVLGPVPGVDGFNEIDPTSDSRTVPGLIVYRFDAPLFFANASFFLDQVRMLVASADPALQSFVLDAEGIVNADTTAVEALETVRTDLQKRDIEFALARTNGHLYGMLERSGFVACCGSDHFYPSVRVAVAAYLTSQGKTEQLARIAQQVDQLQEMTTDMSQTDAGHGEERTP